MTEVASLSEVIAQVLPIIDRHLADADVPLKQRSTHAAVEFVRHFVEAVSTSETGDTTSGDSREFMLMPWFATIYAEVEAWYRDRYGAAMDHDGKGDLLGVVTISGTPFALRVPVVRSRPGRSGQTVWIGFPDGVRDGESPADWIENPPNLERLPLGERRSAEQEAAETAGALRFVNTSLMAVPSSDEKLTGLLAGIKTRLEQAAQLLLQPRPELVQQAYWELQLACEHALKALQQQRTGTFRETHDLFLLYNALDPAPAFDRHLLKRVPRWEETADLRYGQGTRDNRRDCLRCYRAVLQIVAGAVRSMQKLGIGNAEFEIQRPPWMSEADSRSAEHS